MNGSLDGRPSTSPQTPSDSFSTPFKLFDQVSLAGSTRSYSSDHRREPEGFAPLPLFAVSPPEKIYIEPSEVPARYNQPRSPPFTTPSLELVRTKMLSFNEKGSGHAVTAFHVDVSPASYIVASKHGDKTIKIFGLPLSNVISSIKVNFWVSMQTRSRDFFVSSHAILSETSSLVAVSAGFGNSLEIWNWERKKKLQSIDAAFRWAAVKADIYDTKGGHPPLACYRESGDAIDLYPVIPSSTNDPNLKSGGGGNSSKKPFGRPISIDLCRSGMPHVPKLPELAFSSTSPRLVAAAGPRPPRAGHPPPPHSAMLMVWDLDVVLPSPTATAGYYSIEGQGHVKKPSSRPTRVCMPRHAELEMALPCGLAAHGDLVVSIWIPNNVQVTGRPGAWHVEPVTGAGAAARERWVLVWDLGLGRGDTTSVFPIPDENTIACISPDCRYVAYRQGPGADTNTRAGTGTTRNCLVILDTLRGGREVWRMPNFGGVMAVAGGSEQLMDLSRVTSISFSSDSKTFFVGDVSGSIGVYEIRGGDTGSPISLKKQW
jgi:WD40 repeat protein